MTGFPLHTARGSRGQCSTAQGGGWQWLLGPPHSQYWCWFKSQGTQKSHVHFMIRTGYLSPTLTTNKGQRSMDQRLPVSTPASFPLFIQPLLATLVWSGKTVLRQMSSSLSCLQGLPGKGILVVTLHLVSALLGSGPSSVWSCGLISHFYCPTMRWRKAPQSLIMNSSKDRTWSQNLV